MYLIGKPSVQLCTSQSSAPCVNLLGCKLSQIEMEVQEVRQALGQVHMERQQLQQQRKALECLPPKCVSSQDLAIQEMHEKYDRLEEDFKSKVLEVCALRCELEKQKAIAEAAVQAREKEKQACQMPPKQLDTSEQAVQLNLARQRFREAQDELEELRMTSQDQAYQLEQYRNKYLEAQQQVEELRNKIESMEMDNVHIAEQINCVIEKTKMQFKEKLQELAPLPIVLKANQIKLQEYQKGKLLAEHNLEETCRQLEDARQQIVALEQRVEMLSQQDASEEIAQLTCQVACWQNKCNELTEANNKLNDCVDMYMKSLENRERQLEEKEQELAQLSQQLETVREESARQVTRAKDRAENIRRTLQCQITELELQLAQSRALSSAALKDRDEIRQRMQFQINNLSENFDQAQMRIRTLHSQVGFLKRSYSHMFGQNNFLVLT